MDEIVLNKALQDLISQKGSQTGAAEALGISRQYICDILAGRRGFSDMIIDRLGYYRKLVKLPKKAQS